MIVVTPTLTIGEDELDEQFVRASGPGGQNVNKVSTAVRLRFNALSSSTLPDHARRRLLKLAGDKATAEGDIMILAQRFRSQPQNRIDARERLAALIRSALHRPKTRISTKPSKASKQRRLDSKRLRSNVKRTRSKSADSD